MNIGYLFSASIGSDEPKVSCQPLPLIEDVSFLLRAVNVYFKPFLSISSTSLGNSFTIFSVTLKLGTIGVSPPSGGGISQYSITLFGYSFIYLFNILHILISVLFFEIKKEKPRRNYYVFKRINYQNHLMVEVNELRERAFIGSPYPLINMGSRSRADVSNVFPPKGFDDVVELLSLGYIVSSKQDCAVFDDHFIQPVMILFERQQKGLKIGFACLRRV